MVRSAFEFMFLFAIECKSWNDKPSCQQVKKKKNES